MGYFSYSPSPPRCCWPRRRSDARQKLAHALGLRISVCHFPPGTSKWNKIEHRMFCHITENWRGRPLVSHGVVVNPIGATTTRGGLAIRSELDEGRYLTGRQVSDEQMDTLSIKRDVASGTTPCLPGIRNDQAILARSLTSTERASRLRAYWK